MVAGGDDAYNIIYQKPITKDLHAAHSHVLTIFGCGERKKE